MKNTKNCLFVLTFLAFLFVLMAGCGLWFFSSGILAEISSTGLQENYVAGQGERKVALVDVKGEISNSEGGASLFATNGASAPRIIQQIEAAIADPYMDGILIEMDTPGGEIVASDLIYQKLLEARESGLSVVTYMHTLGASGGYYIATASDMILANELTTTGSIGVYSVFQDVSGLYEKLGIKQRIIKHGEYKTGAGLFDADDEGEEDKLYQAMVDEAYERFAEVVSEGRNMTLEEVDNVADGKLFTGRQALDNGLIDKIGGFDEAVDEMKELTGLTEFQVVNYTISDFWGQVFGVMKGLNVNGILMEIAAQEKGMKLMYMMD